MTEKDIFLSIIIPFYNTKIDELKHCIDSLQAIHIPTEILIVDDGSDEIHSIKGRESIAFDERIRWLKKDNGGVSSARNMGIQNARGKYLCFVDSDDQISTEFANYVNDHNEEIYGDWVLFDIQVKDLKKGTQFYRRLFPQYKDRTELSYDEVLNLRVTGKELSECWGKLVSRRHVLEHRIEFPIGVLTGEDRIFNTRLLMDAKSIEYVPCTAYHYYFVPRMGERLLRNPKKRYEHLALERKELKELLDSRAEGRTKDQLAKAANVTAILWLVQDAFVLAKAGCLDRERRKMLNAWIKEQQIFKNIHFWTCNERKKKTCYMLLKYRMWFLIEIIGRCRKG